MRILISSSNSIKTFSTTGLTLIGSGVDSRVYADPSDKKVVLRVTLMKDADAAKDWYDFCKKYPSQFYPVILDVQTMDSKRGQVVVARIERLKEITAKESREIRKMYDELQPKDFKTVKTPGDNFRQALTFAVKYGEQVKGYNSDIEDDEDAKKVHNIMKRGTTFVVSDPWVEF